MHGCDGALSRLEQEEKPPVCLALDAGDAVRGSNTVFRRREPILERMSRLGYAAQAMGNREFHYLRSVQRQRSRQRAFPLLAANLVDLRGTSSGLWEKQAVLEVGGWKVGVFGATVVQYPVGAWWERLTGFRFLAPEDCLPALCCELKKRCDLVIFLSHLGLDRDRGLAPRLPGLDLILGGHTHVALDHPVEAGSVRIVQAGSHSRYLGRLVVRRGSPLEVDYRLLECQA